MGAESSILENCQWGPQIACPPKFPWEMSPVTKPDGTSATVFELKSSDNKDEILLRQFATTLRRLRHPNIIRFIGSGQSSDGFWLATEPVLPLFTFVSDMSSQELYAGLYDLLQGLDFLHSKLGVCHNNICLLSVYVSCDGSWKWGGLEHACKFTEATQEFLDRCRPHRHEDSLSPEEKTNRVEVGGSLGYSRDVFAFGALADAVLDLVKDKDNCSQMLEQQLSMCLMAEPSARPSVGSLLNLSVFKSDLIEILNFLHHITAKTVQEKKDFFSNLMPRLYHLPEIAIARRLVVPLLARFVLLDEWAVTHVLPHLLIPKGTNSRKSSTFVQGLLPEHLFRQFVINHIYNIFHVYDCHVRLVLLEQFPHYVNMFTRQQLEDDIFLQILLGVRDTDDQLVASSLRALAELVPVLGGDIVVGGARKPFFFHGMPKQASVHNLVKPNAPHNVMAVLKDHKPLLKNLAMSSKLALDRSLAEKEKKMTEREQRKEEAKIRREERRNQQEKQIDSQLKGKCVQDNSDGQSSDIVIEQVSESDKEESNGKVEDNDDDMVHRNSLDKESDWSDWEDADGEISDQIEIELQAMPSFMSIEHKVQTSPSPYRSHSAPSPPPIKLDWSDVPEADRDASSTSRMTSSRTVGSLHLGMKSRQASGDNPSTAIISTGTNNGFDSSSETRLQLVVKNTNSLSASTTNEKSKLNGIRNVAKKSEDGRHTGDLGAGLDIKSVKILKKSTPPELDFFADMAPIIAESRTTTLLGSGSIDNTVPLPGEMEPRTMTLLGSCSIDNTVQLQAGETKPEQARSLLFAVSAVSEEEVKGWSEDDCTDWDIESQGVMQTGS